MVSAYAEGVKEFVVYTALRILLFLASLAMVLGVWCCSPTRAAAVGVVIAFVLSGDRVVLPAQPAARRVRRAGSRSAPSARHAPRSRRCRAREDADDRRPDGPGERQRRLRRLSCRSTRLSAWPRTLASSGTRNL